MTDFVSEWYLTLKAWHIISVITWMAALFYLPRLYVYHAQETVGSPTSELFKVMERRLHKGIMTPSLVVVVLTGGLLLFIQDWSSGWLHVKLVLVVLMVVAHFLLCPLAPGLSAWTATSVRTPSTGSPTRYRRC